MIQICSFTYLCFSNSLSFKIFHIKKNIQKLESDIRQQSNHPQQYVVGCVVILYELGLVLLGWLRAIFLSVCLFARLSVHVHCRERARTASDYDQVHLLQHIKFWCRTPLLLLLLLLLFVFIVKLKYEDIPGAALSSLFQVNMFELVYVCVKMYMFVGCVIPRGA